MTMTSDAPHTSLSSELKQRIRAELTAGTPIDTLEQRYALSRFVLWGCLSAGAERGPRQPHFQRTRAPEIDLTADEITIVRHVAAHRFLRATHIARLLNHRSAKKLSDSLTLLFRHGYLDRPSVQLERYTTTKRQPYVYGLGNRGAALLAGIDDIPAAKVNWTDKNREAGRPFLKHTLLIADVNVGLELAIRNRSDVTLITRDQILANAPDATRNADNPWKFRAKVPGPDGTLQDQAVIPDGVFGLDFTAARKRVYFLLEADRATMPIVRSDLTQTSMQKKFMTYFYGHRAGQHQERYGVGNFRVLTVTTNRERQASMMASVNTVTGGKGSNLFHFIDAASVASTTDFLSLEWTNSRGETMQLDG